MADVTEEEIRKIVREVVSRMGLKMASHSERSATSSRDGGARVLIVFLAGVRKLDEALRQSQLIEKAAGKCGVFTGESARSWVCGEDVREKTGARCILDTVKPDGLEKVLARADVLVLPTLCLKVAAKVANLTCDDSESSIVFSALLQGKKVLASNDGFLVCDILVNEKLKEEIEKILVKLENYGVTFCPTEQLAESYAKLVAAKESKDLPSSSVVEETGDEAGFRLITAKVVTAAANSKQASILLAPGGIVTPLARDMAREYAIKILQA
jgi:glycosyltransferase involved in cell wall biosynthesis